MYYTEVSTRTVRLDDEAEATLAKLRKATGLTISELLKRGLAAYEKSTPPAPRRRAYDVWKSLDLGEGDPNIPPAANAKEAVKEIIRKKHERSQQ